jgi:hypothetical protein
VTAPQRRDNGLIADSYVPLTDIAPALAPQVLSALGRARIAAYLAESPRADALRLYVASAERIDARTIVAAVVRASGDAAPLADPLDGIDSDAEFARLIADWHVDTHTAIREAERDLTREDEDWRARLNPPPAADTPWLDEEHYVPPPPPPLPRFAAPTILAMLLIAASIVLLGFGGEFGIETRLTLLVGVIGVLLGVGILLTRMRDRGDDDDDGAML